MFFSSFTMLFTFSIKSNHSKSVSFIFLAFILTFLFFRYLFMQVPLPDTKKFLMSLQHSKRKSQLLTHFVILLRHILTIPHN